MENSSQLFSLGKKKKLNQTQWLTTATPATQEAEIMRNIVQGQHKQKVIKTLSQPTSWLC
jgi:hypothetical protein